MDVHGPRAALYRAFQRLTPKRLGGDTGYVQHYPRDSAATYYEASVNLAIRRPR